VEIVTGFDHFALGPVESIKSDVSLIEKSVGSRKGIETYHQDVAARAGQPIIHKMSEGPHGDMTRLEVGEGSNKPGCRKACA
jgi:hypothetical protein